MLTDGNKNELRVEIKYNGSNYFAIYDDFNVDDESKMYGLTVDGYQSNSSLTNALRYHSGSKFPTYDNDNDNDDRNCAQTKGGYWHNICQTANLNGYYYDKNWNGICWHGLTTGGGITETEMKIRRVHN